MKQRNTGAGKRSQFDAKKNIAFAGGFESSAFKGNKAYSVPQWKGTTAARKSSYPSQVDGNRFRKPSRFQGASASQAGQRSRFQGTTARTSRYKAGRAGEDAGKRLAKPTDAWTDFRRKVYPEPLIMSKEDYDRMTVEETRSILGRD